eukprot:357877-Chlamydomonas_euryale.AAC.10
MTWQSSRLVPLQCIVVFLIPATPFPCPVPHPCGCPSMPRPSSLRLSFHALSLIPAAVLQCSVAPMRLPFHALVHLCSFQLASIPDCLLHRAHELGCAAFGAFGVFGTFGMFGTFACAAFGAFGTFGCAAFGALCMSASSLRSEGAEGRCGGQVRRAYVLWWQL